MEAIVLAREVHGRHGLVAYLVPASAGGLDVEALRADLKQILPSFMVPTWIVVVDGFPFTPNGKVDYRALPAPESAGPAAHRPAETPTERDLAAIWQRVLGVETVGMDDDFFQVGGHSLRAVQVLSAIGTTFGVDLTVQDMFDVSTLGGLAARVERAMVDAIPEEELERLLQEVTAAQPAG
jgi:acyl carrier protein